MDDKGLSSQKEPGQHCTLKNITSEKVIVKTISQVHLCHVGVYYYLYRWELHDESSYQIRNETHPSAIEENDRSKHFAMIHQFNASEENPDSLQKKVNGCCLQWER
jgi:hypothetical protein